MAAQTLATIPSSAFASVLCSYLQASDLLALRSTCKRCYALMHEEDAEALWEMVLTRDFGVISDFRMTLGIKSHSDRVPRQTVKSLFGVDPGSDDFIVSTDTAFESWKHWMAISARFEGDMLDQNKPEISPQLFLRAAQFWRTILRWCRDREASSRLGSSIESTLLPGVPRSSWPSECRRRRPLWAIQAVYAFVGGQREEAALVDSFAGLLGFCNAYNYYSCTHLALPMRQLETHGQHVAVIGRNRLSMMSIAATSIGVGATDGMVYLGSERAAVPMVAHANAGANVTADVGSTAGTAEDTALLWLEEYATRLASGYYATTQVDSVPGDVPVMAISLIPQLSRPMRNDGPAPVVSRTVTKGIEVIAGAVYVPQCQPTFGFIYKLQIRLLLPNEEGYMSPAERGFRTCQLESRHWHFYDTDTNQGDRVDGEGVVGEFPYLFEGGYFKFKRRQEGAFSYQSCSRAMNGYFEGHMMFVPGNLQLRTGPAFPVQLGRVGLNMAPGFIY